jgi:hypothetical protein
MKKTAFAVMSLVMLFSTAVVSQLCNSANGNPGWRPWENWEEISYPTIDVVSPVEGGSYPSNDVWLNFTLTKPSDWLNKTHYYISYASYCVDGTADGFYSHAGDNSDKNEVIVSVWGDRCVAKTSTSYSFSINLEGLTAGEHTIEIFVDGTDGWTDFGYTILRTSFKVYTSSPTPTPIPTPTATPEPTAAPEVGVQNTSQYLATGGIVAFSAIAVLVGLVLLLYGIKRK